LSVLEAELGVSLLRRTRRRVSLTPQGRDYFSECQEPLNILQDAERVLTQAQKKPEGLLRITIPFTLSRDPLVDFISAFSKDHPRIRVDLFITNTVTLNLLRRIHRQRQTHSVAAGVGHFADSGFRRLPESKVSAFATECLLRGVGNLEKSALDRGLTCPLARLNDRRCRGIAGWSP